MLTLEENVAEKQYHLPFIDGLRGIAVLLVLMVHVSQHVGNDHLQSNPVWSVLIMNFGARGVQLFFIISAFTLFNSSKHRFQREKKPKILFYLRRFFRIFPLWAIMVMIVSIVSNASLEVVLFNLSFLFGFFRFAEGIELIGPSWSLFVEETFYLMLPFLFIHLNLIRTIKYLIFTLILALLWNFVAPKLGVPYENGYIFQFPLTWYYVFFLGIFLHFIINMHANFFKNKTYARMLDIVAFISLFLAIVLSGTHFFKRFYSYYSIMSTFSLALLFLACAHEFTIFGKIARTLILKKFGIYCYSIYLIHQPLLEFLDPYKSIYLSLLSINSAAIEVKFLAYFPVVLFVMFISGKIIFNVIERPSINLGKKVIKCYSR
jgi:peptidoglycan/LPS O-acetylase OafA/YrhL